MENEVKQPGKLLKYLHEPASGDDQPIKSTYCSLALDRPCCHGLGYSLKAQGGKTVALICECVRQCPTCLGLAQIVGTDKVSRACKSPSPRKTINLINEAAIPARYLEASLSSFSNRTGNGELVISKINGWLKKFNPYGGKGLVLGGPVGVGKTYLLAAIAKALMAKGIGVKFIDFFQLLAEIKAGYSEHKSDLSVIAPLLAVDVLIVDELGKGRNTEFELTILDQLVMGRYNANKTIIASTNCQFRDQSAVHQYNVQLDQVRSKHGDFEPEAFGTLESRVGKRIYSRLAETTEIVELSGSDFRRI